jgi:hypothetical protein
MRSLATESAGGAQSLIRRGPGIGDPIRRLILLIGVSVLSSLSGYAQNASTQLQQLPQSANRYFERTRYLEAIFDRLYPSFPDASYWRIETSPGNSPRLGTYLELRPMRPAGDPPPQRRPDTFFVGTKSSALARNTARLPQNDPKSVGSSVSIAALNPIPRSSPEPRPSSAIPHFAAVQTYVRKWMLSPVSEPGYLALMGASLVMLAVGVRRRFRS